MNYQDELRLSFYKEIADIDKRHRVVLVQHSDTGKIYVKKTLAHYDRSVYEYLRLGRLPGIPVIEELIESDGVLTVIEDHISGHNLDELLEAKAFSAAETVRLVSALCDILSPLHMHDPPIIHRDIKCSNIIIDNEGKVYLLDFNASRKVSGKKQRDTDLIGTEAYAAPEQYGFGQSDQRTDIYSLGILMHKLLTGGFPSETEYTGELSHIIAKATALDPDRRYQNLQMLKTALQVHAPETAAHSVSGLSLKKALSRLPYPVRELPGFRSGKPVYFILALAWYVFLVAFGFCSIEYNPDFTAGQTRFYNIITFFIFFVPTLYLGNYLGVRDRLPWKKTSSKPFEILRLCTGAVVSLLLILALATVIAMILGY